MKKKAGGRIDSHSIAIRAGFISSSKDKNSGRMSLIASVLTIERKHDYSRCSLRALQENSSMSNLVASF
jgi:hypothetical protein